MAEACRLVLSDQFVQDEYRFRNNSRAVKDLAKIKRQLAISGTNGFKDLHRVGDCWTIRAGEGRRLLIRASESIIELVRFGEHDDCYMDANRATARDSDVARLGAAREAPPRCVEYPEDTLLRLGVGRQHLASLKRCESVRDLEALESDLGADLVLRLLELEGSSLAVVLAEHEREQSNIPMDSRLSPKVMATTGAEAATSRVTPDAEPAVGAGESGTDCNAIRPGGELPGREAEVVDLLKAVQTEIAGLKVQISRAAAVADLSSIQDSRVADASAQDFSAEQAFERATPNHPVPSRSPHPGDPWDRPRGSDKWILRPSSRSMTRLSDRAGLAALVGQDRASSFIDRCLALRPGGGRVWVDDCGNAVTLLDGRDIFLGRLGTPLAESAVGNATLLSAVEQALRAAPASTAAEIIFALRQGPHASTTKKEINSLLYGRPAQFVKDGSPAPRWRLRGVAPGAGVGESVSPDRATSRHDPVRHDERDTYQHLFAAPEHPREVQVTETKASRSAPEQVLGLFAWQREAVATWYAHGCRGIVEAVTGTGKTVVGLEAVAHAARAGHKSTVLVPSVDLQDQWASRFASFLPHLSVARLGGKSSGDPARCDVTIAVVNSAIRTDLSALSPDSLLVADEVHRYGSEQFQYALRARYERRLGLTATLERSDDAVEDVLKPYFGGSILTVGFDRAIRDKVVAPFRLVMAPVGMTKDETEQYERLSRQISNGVKALRGSGALGAGGGASLVQQLGRLRGVPGRVGQAARQAESGMRERRLLLAGLEGKLDAVEELAETIGESQGTVLFTQSKEMADEAALRLREWDVAASALHSDMGVPERRAALDGLESGRLRALAAPKLLDEGIDVPTVDLGIVMTASGSRRQMVQRLGRIIRRKNDGRPVDFVILYAADTVEDPESGAHEGFFDLVGQVATNRLQLEEGWSADQLRSISR